MVDNRSAGFFGIGGSFNFKSGDISGTAAKSQDDRQSPGMEYFQQDGFDEEGSYHFNNSHFVDRSAQLNATLNSLAMMNVAHLINNDKLKKAKQEDNKENLKKEDEDDFIVEPVTYKKSEQKDNEDFMSID